MSRRKLLSPDRPLNPARWPFFYGWMVVSASTVGIAMSIPGQAIGIGVFTESLIHAFGISRVQISMVYLISTLLSGFLLPWFGRLLDRYGARVLNMAASLGLGGTLLYLGLSDDLCAFLARGTHPSLANAIAIGLLLIGFFNLRFFGQGILPTISRVMISKWFNRRRGLAAAIQWIFITFIFASAPRILDTLIDALSWKGAWLSTGAVLLFGFTAISWAFYRDNPEECGLSQDGFRPEIDEEKREKRQTFVTYHEFTLSEALHTLPFWVFNLTICFYVLIFNALIFNIVSLAAEMGMEEKMAFNLFLFMWPFVLVFSFLGGWLSDRYEIKYLIIIFLVLQLGSLSAILLGPSQLGIALLIASFGSQGGLFGTLNSVTLPRFFGRQHLGAITSFAMANIVISSALGPLLFSLSKQYTGSYQASVIFCLIVPLVLLPWAHKSDNPQQRYTPVEQ